MKNFGDNLTQWGTRIISIPVIAYLVVFSRVKAGDNIQERKQFEPKPIFSNKWYVTMPSPLQEKIFDSYHYF